MNSRPNKTMIERIGDWWRGLFAQPSGNRRATRGDQGATNEAEQSAVLGDLPDSERGHETGSREGRDAAEQRASTPNADIERQDDVPSATGASDDEFRAGGYSAELTDQADVEEAAEADEGDVSSDAPGATGSFRSMTGGNEPADDSGWTVGGSTSAAEDSGSVASRGAGLEDPATIESDTPGMTGSGTDRTGSAGVSDIDDAGGADDAGASDSLAGGALDEAESEHDAVGERDPGRDVTQQSADRQEAELDRSMEGDTDYATAGYPSEEMDIDITDTDDLGVEDAASTDDADDDAADFSDDVGELGLRDSETATDDDADAGVAGRDTSGLAPASPDDVGVGEQAEVDDTSRIATTDDATSAEVRDPDIDTIGERSESTAGATGGTSAPSGGPAGGVRGDGTTNTPEGYPIKGNASSKIYHMPGMASYAGTKAEWCFASEEDAIAAGYRAPGGRNQGRTRGSSSGSRAEPRSDASGRDKNAAGGASPSAAPSDSESEGMQSFASTADRDALSTMQDTLAEEPASSDAANAQGLGGLGSDPAPADDPTSTGVSSPATGEPLRDSQSDDTARRDSGLAAGERGQASKVGGEAPVSQESEAGERAATDDLASFGATTDPAQAAAVDVSSMQTDTIEQASAIDDSGLPADTDEPEGVGAQATEDQQGFAGAVRGDGSRTCPADYPIKGNGGSMIYHTPGRTSYDATIAEWCFATEEDAVNAGFRPPRH